MGGSSADVGMAATPLEPTLLPFPFASLLTKCFLGGYADFTKTTPFSSIYLTVSHRMMTLSYVIYR